MSKEVYDPILITSNWLFDQGFVVMPKEQFELYEKEKADHQREVEEKDDKIEKYANHCIQLDSRLAALEGENAKMREVLEKIMQECADEGHTEMPFTLIKAIHKHAQAAIKEEVEG